MLLRIDSLLNDFASFFKNLTRSLYLCIGKDIQLKLCRRYRTLPDFGGRIESHNWKKYKFTNARNYQFLIIFHKETAHVTFSNHRHINFGYVEVSYPFTSVSRTQLKAFWKLLIDFLLSLSFEKMSRYFCSIFALAKTTKKQGESKPLLYLTFRSQKFHFP